MTKRAVRTVFLLCAASLPLGAQAEKPPAPLDPAARAKLVQEATAKLRADDLATVAWGAHLAADSMLTECVADVRAKLATLRTARDQDAICTIRTLLDALIRNDAKLAAEELLPFADCGAPALILAAREPATHVGVLRGCFAGCDGWMDEERAAAGMMLAALRDDGFAAELLRGTCEIWVAACDQGKAEEPEVFGSHTTGCSRYPLPKGFPRIPRYEIGDADACKSPADPKAAWPVPFHRSFYHDGLHCHSTQGYDVYRERRLAWLVRMLGEGSRETVAAIDKPVAIVWKDRESFDAELTKQRAAVEQNWRRLVELCVARKLLVADAAKQLQPNVQFVFDDERKDTKTPLPKDKFTQYLPEKR